MNILVIGNGGRESAICDTIKRFRPEAKLYVAPGNGGTAVKYTNVEIGVNEINKLVSFAKDNDIDLTVVGPEEPLVLGVVDAFQKEGLKVFGPNEACATFEGSKDFTKIFLTKYNVPTAKYLTFTKEEEMAAKEAVQSFSLPVVIKADGLAAGKGVLICESYKDAEEAISEIFSGKFQEAGDKIVIEEFLTGIEASLLCLVDGKTIVPLETARDYKRALDNDGGLNTGGMGGFSPNPIITPQVKAQIETEILNPIIEGFKTEGLDYHGILFIGLMIEEGKAKVLEFNVRFGDPETQSILSRLETDLVEVFEACMNGTLAELNLKWSTKPSVTVVLASRGYPETSEKGVPIYGLDTLEVDTYLYHAGTKLEDDIIKTNGGRVLAVTRIGETLEEARLAAYKEVEKIKFDGMQYRTDIAKM
ncbi:phosphoribosylamine--glycine ligase [Niameybacter massiliensis]|uniref:Phosphoribosylamine--glycine ligase n=1 Tax=Holtiella tumoricola TaxID=3018743 RepID=A0AA42DRT0_9FIRM|nr:phosphoribosylamine--glycine ligase [Holtiella tumoricola]MDA3733843.1 phosphoribosylamine--glycine ligase [Holtiella tumoricola]